MSYENPVTTEAENTNSKGKNPKNKKKRWLIAGISVLVAIGIVAGALAIIFPGFYKPKSLGVKPTEDEYNNVLGKLGKDGELSEIKTSFTSEELTSYFNYSESKDLPFKNVQVKINQDNSIEFSGTIDKNALADSELFAGMDDESLENMIPMLKYVPLSINLYAHLFLEVVDNKSVGLEFKEIKVKGVEIPTLFYNTEAAMSNINKGFTEILSKRTKRTGATYDLLRVEDEKLLVEGLLGSSLFG